MKIYTNELGHMTKMAAMPIYGMHMKIRIKVRVFNYSPFYTPV